MCTKYVLPQDLKEIVNKLLKLGWSFSRGRHFKLKAPNGKSIAISVSPSDSHTVHNLYRSIRRIGYNPQEILAQN